MRSDAIGVPGPPPGQGGYYPQQPQQSYQGGPGYQGQPGPGYAPQPQPQTVYVFVFPVRYVNRFLRVLQSTAWEEFRWGCLHRLFGWPSLLLLRRRCVASW